MGCKTCVTACPWGAPQWNPETGKVVKCDYCKDRVDAGLKPACATICTTHCLHFGKVEDMTQIRRERHAKVIASLENQISEKPPGRGGVHPSAARTAPPYATTCNRTRWFIRKRTHARHQMSGQSNADSGLREAIESNAITHPRSRRIAEEILDLLTDVAWGRAGGDHLAAIAALADELAGDEASPGAMAAGQSLRDALGEHREVFQSHIETHNCATGDCVRLVPAPCQMTCPAGIDVPTYVNLIGQGHDAEAIEVIRRDNPFPWVCGLVCTRPCEFMCVRGRVDKPDVHQVSQGLRGRAGALRPPLPQPGPGSRTRASGSPWSAPAPAA